MVWGAFPFHDRTPLNIIDGNLTGDRYLQEIIRPLQWFYLLCNLSVWGGGGREGACIKMTTPDLVVLEWLRISSDKTMLIGWIG